MKEGAVVGVVVVGIVAAHLTRMTIGPARSGPIIRVFFFLDHPGSHVRRRQAALKTGSVLDIDVARHVGNIIIIGRLARHVSFTLSFLFSFLPSFLPCLLLFTMMSVGEKKQSFWFILHHSHATSVAASEKAHAQCSLAHHKRRRPVSRARTPIVSWQRIRPGGSRWRGMRCLGPVLVVLVVVAVAAAMGATKRCSWSTKTRGGGVFGMVIVVHGWILPMVRCRNRNRLVPSSSSTVLSLSSSFGEFADYKSSNCNKKKMNQTTIQASTAATFEYHVNGEYNDPDHNSYSYNTNNASATDELGPERRANTGMNRSLRRKNRSSRVWQRLSNASLGDIMSTTTTTTTTTTMPTIPMSTTPTNQHHHSRSSTGTASLSLRYGIVHPLDRMALTANGNLQRLVSSYYDAPVQVVVRFCQPRLLSSSSSVSSVSSTQPQGTVVSDPSVDWILKPETRHLLDRLSDPPDDTVNLPPEDDDDDDDDDQAPSDQHGRIVLPPPPLIYDRVVDLQVFGQTFCTATSVITVRDAPCQELIRSGTVGLGQLFRFLNVLPEFTLLQAGQPDGEPKEEGGGGGFWREYRLDCEEMSCRIHEAFRPGMWTMSPLPLSDNDSP